MLSPSNQPRANLEPEWMDAPDADPRLLQESLAFIRKMNLLLGYSSVIVRQLEHFSRRWQPGETIHVLDVATGSGDIPRAILRWADRRGFDVRIIGIDLHFETLLDACSFSDERVRFVRTDAMNLPFGADSFDYAITSMFLHHLDNQRIMAVFKEMARVARRGIIAADILRTRRAYFWIRVLTLLANPMVKHDAKLSVKQALTKEEAILLREGAGIGFAQYSAHFAHRFVLAGEKN